ncbi:MAG: LUD domain-containing protein [Acidimicrobiales bacterium]
MTTMTVRYRDTRHGAAGFSDAWTALGGTVATVGDDALLDSIRAWCGDAATVVGPQPRFDGLVDALRWPGCGVEAAARVEVAVVHATAAVAQTGSIVVDSTANGGRALSLLAPRALFVIDAANIVDTPADVLRNRDRWWPNGPPSQIVMITGPSRSADIEMTLTIGVHGPGTVHALIVH